MSSGPPTMPILAALWLMVFCDCNFSLVSDLNDLFVNLFGENKFSKDFLMNAY